MQVVQDVIPLLPPKPAQLIGARLCNFPTGHWKPLLPKHNAWINGDLIKATVDRHADFWIDIQAYASKTGSESVNQRLSVDRREEVKASIIAAIPMAKGRFLQEIAWGESLSAGGENDDNGYWRAVEVYAYGSVPRGRMPDPLPAKPIQPIIVSPDDRWFVPNLSLSGVSLVEIFGGGGLSGTITFQEGGIDGPDDGAPDFTYSMVLAGGAVGLMSRGIPLEKWKFTEQVLQNSKIAQILQYVADNGGLSYANLPSWTEGSCFRNKYTVSRLQSSDFLGDCATIFVSGNAGLGGDGFYLLLFGLPTGFWFWPTTRVALQTGMIGPDVAYNFKGFAVIYNLGVGLTGSVGAAANAMCGRIF